MIRYELNGKFDEKGDTYFTGIVDNPSIDEKYFVGVPLEEIIDIYKDLTMGHTLQIEFNESEEAVEEAEEHYK